MSEIIPLHHSLYMFDLFEQGLPGRSCAYLYDGPKKVLIETGSSLSHDHILNSLSKLNLTPQDLDYVIVTHIHLDHAGGAGKLAKLAPQAKFVAHPRAARHLINPVKLIQGANQVYGEAMHTLFGEILPVAENQVLIRADGESLDIGGRTLFFYDTPGHAKHHFTVYDPDIKSVFSGDALGIRYVKTFTGWDFECVLPSTSPTDFDPEGVIYTANKLQQLDLTTVYHTHFGPSPAMEAIQGTLEGAHAFKSMADRVYAKTPSWEPIREALIDTIAHLIKAKGYQFSQDLHELNIDLELNAKGLWVYEEKMTHSA